MASEKMNNVVGNGVMKLCTPILSRNVELTELKYDYNAITAMEYCDAMAQDPDNTSPFQISAKQGLLLFALAVRKAGGDVDEHDISERMGAVDAMQAAQRTSLFFGSSLRALRELSTNE